MSGKRILVVEDDEGLAELLCDNLRFEGYQVERVSDGEGAIAASRTFSPDLVLLDIVLPGLNGFELCRVWSRQRVAVIMLTARGQKHDKIRGFAAGADDYVTKPFDLEELLARIHAVLQRARPETTSEVTFGSVTINLKTMEAWNNGKPLELTTREFDLLRYLMERPNAVVYRDELLRELWHYSAVISTRAVDSAVMRLRRKLSQIRTIQDSFRQSTATAIDWWAEANGSRDRLRAIVYNVATRLTTNPDSLSNTMGSRPRRLLAGAAFQNVPGLPTSQQAQAGVDAISGRLRF